MKSLELFAGIGGIALAAEHAGIETLAFCERNEFCQKVLNKHWPKTPIFDDIKELTKEKLIDRGVDVEAIELISGGFPCQPFSIAGERKGTDDDRDLWPEMFRIIKEIKPTWIVGENVANFVKMELERTLVDLESEGYETQSFVIPACSVKAEHRRDRVFIVAYSDSKYVERSKQKKVQREYSLQRKFSDGSLEIQRERSAVFEPKLLRAYNGIPNQVDRLTGLGNAVVPAQILPIFEAIMKAHYNVY